MCDRPSAWLPTPFASRRHARLGCPLSACVRRRTMTRATASRASRRPRGRPSRCARRPRVAGALPLSAARHTPRTAPDLACVTEASCSPQALTPPAPERSRMFMPLCGRAAHWPGPGAGALARMGRQGSRAQPACSRVSPAARRGASSPARAPGRQAQTCGDGGRAGAHCGARAAARRGRGAGRRACGHAGAAGPPQVRGVPGVHGGLARHGALRCAPPPARPGCRVSRAFRPSLPAHAYLGGSAVRAMRAR